MKTFLQACLLAVLCIPLFTSAQVRLGISGGASAMSIWDKQISFDVQSSKRPGLPFGLTCEVGLSPTLSLQSGVWRIQRGSTWSLPVADEFGNQIGTQEYIVILDAISIPVALNAKFGTRVKWLLQGGAFVDFHYRASYITQGQNTTDPIKIQFSDVGALFATGVEIPLNSRIFFNALIREEIGFRGQFARNPWFRFHTPSFLLGLAYEL